MPRQHVHYGRRLLESHPFHTWGQASLRRTVELAHQSLTRRTMRAFAAHSHPAVAVRVRALVRPSYVSPLYFKAVQRRIDPRPGVIQQRSELRGVLVGVRK